MEPQVQKLFDYIRERGTIIAIQQYDKKLLIHGDVSKVVAESIRIGMLTQWQISSVAYIHNMQIGCPGFPFWLHPLLAGSPSNKLPRLVEEHPTSPH